MTCECWRFFWLIQMISCNFATERLIPFCINLKNLTDMKRNWIFGILGVVVMMTCLLTSASGDNLPSDGASPVNEGVKSTETQGKTCDNNYDFAFNLFRTINGQQQGDVSTIVSPVSVSYLLGMLNEGAEGETRRQITEVLGINGSVQEINEYFKQVTDVASQADPAVTVEIANCINVITGKRLIPQYKTDMRRYYGALAEAVNYDADIIAATINKWCKEHTHGMIPEILKKEELNANRVMYLLNAVYFKAPWTKEFNPKETLDKDFTKQNGSIVKLPMMHLKTKAAYIHTGPYKMLCLPYGNESYSMYVLLPEQGKTVDDVIQSLTAGRLKSQQARMTHQTVDILMPRFTTQSETQLVDVLTAMGMPRAFEKNKAEFPNMIQGDSLFVSMMKQKAKIEVNEKGTKAAAVTVAEMSSRSAMPRPDYVEFHATRPFVYYIVERSTGTIFFMGTYCGD